MIQSIKNIVHGMQALLATIWYDFPSRRLTLIGVTGTDGKTTTSNLIYAVLRAWGKKTALISTIDAKIGDTTIDTGFHVTTPDPWNVPKLLAQSLKAGCTHVVMEVSSHGLDQNRVLGCNFAVGVLTNISHEHLDYHKTFDQYLNAKAKLLQRAKVAILNKDDPSYSRIEPILATHERIVTYAIKAKADVMLKTIPFKTSLPGQYNQYNCLAAIAASHALEIPKEAIQKGISAFEGLPGRFEHVKNDRELNLIIDFAHKPNALKNVLQTVQKLYPKGKIIALFGAAGERDYLKRPMMGEISAKLADVTIITAEDPRSETVEDISDQIASGCIKGGAKKIGLRDNTTNKKSHQFILIPDRNTAIIYALHIAKKNDTVLFLGKGHEKSMCYGDIEHPWSEHAAIKAALAA